MRLPPRGIWFARVPLTTANRPLQNGSATEKHAATADEAADKSAVEASVRFTGVGACI